MLTVGDTKALDAYPNAGIGQIVQLALKNDPKLPVMPQGGFEYLRKQISRIVAKTATTVTISPGLLFDLPESLAPVLRPAGDTSSTAVDIGGAKGTGLGIGFAVLRRAPQAEDEELSPTANVCCGCVKSQFDPVS